MKLNLQRSLVFFDIESTCLGVAKDKIIDLSFVKLFSYGEKEIQNFRCNPEKPIQQAASEVHEIYDEDVKAPSRRKSMQCIIPIKLRKSKLFE